MTTKKKEITEYDLSSLCRLEVSVRNFVRELKTSRSLYKSMDERKVVYARQHKEITSDAYISALLAAELKGEIYKAKTDLAFANIALSSYGLELPDFDINGYVFENAKGNGKE